MPTTDKELLFCELVLSDLHEFLTKTQKLIMGDNLPKPKVFISYAWPRKDNMHFDAEKDIQSFILDLYSRLYDLGATVLFDIKSMTLGTNIDYFMQQGVNGCDIVLMIGTQTYKTRSEQDTNVKCEIEYIKEKIKQKGSGCVVPILYRGEFTNALPALGQILGTNCSDEFLYHENLPILIEGIFQLLNNKAYQSLKQRYLAKINDIRTHGLSDTAMTDFSQNRVQKIRAALDMRSEAVKLLQEQNAKGHPDYVSRPIGTEPPSVRMLLNLKKKYGQFTHVQALYGQPLALEGQYINVQMLYHVLEEKKTDEQRDSKEWQEKKKSETDIERKEFQDARVTSFETIFSNKESLDLNQLFIPADQLLTSNQKTKESKPNLPPHFILLQGRAGIGKTTFVNFVTREWSLGRLWPEYNWVFSLRFRDLRSGAMQLATERKEAWTLADWVYTIHFASQMNKTTFESLWTWLIEPDLKNNKILFILDGYDEAPLYHPCEQALTDLLNSQTPKIITSRPYGLSDLPRERRELEIVGFTDENVDKYVSIYFKENENKAKAISLGLRTTPSLWGSAHIPVTLNILCGVLETELDISATITNLNTMSVLYETMEISLLERAYLNTPGKEKEHAKQLESLDKNSKIELLTTHYKSLRQYLAKLAFVAFSKEKLILTPQEVTTVLKESGVSVTELSGRINELLNLGLLKKVVDDVLQDETNYEFLHLTFQEYYSGHYLLWQVEQASPTLLVDFAKIKLDPRYQIVLWFVAGTIKDKDKFNLFMRALAAPQGGDMLGNMQLGLMIRCTEENWVLAQQTGWTNAITKMLQHRIHGAWKRFKRHQISNPPIWVTMLKISDGKYIKQTGNLDLFAELTSKATHSDSYIRLRFAEYIGWLTLITPDVPNIFNKLVSENTWVKRTAVETLTHLGAAAASPESIKILIDLIVKHKNERNDAIKAIAKLGSVAFTPELLKLLPDLLTDKNSEVRSSAFEFIEKLDVALIPSEILGMLPNLLISNSYTDQYVAKRIICKLGAAVGKQEFFIPFFSLMIDNNEDIRKKIIQNINILAEVATRPELLTMFLKMLTDNKGYVRQIAIKAIGELGPSLATVEIIALIPALLLDSEKDVRLTTLGTLSKLGAIAATPEIIALLPKLLANSNYSMMKYKVVYTWLMLTYVAKRSEFLANFAHLVTDNDSDIRSATAYAVEYIGSPVPPDFLTMLVKLLVESKYEVRRAIVVCIGNLGTAAATPEFLLNLHNILIKDWASNKVNFELLETLANFGGVAISPEIQEILCNLLTDRKYVLHRCDVLRFIISFGKAVITPDILAMFPKLLRDSNEIVACYTVEVIAELDAITITSEMISEIQVQLPRLLVAESYYCNIALKAISKLGPICITSEILNILASLLINNHRNTCELTADYISSLGAPAATLEILAALTKLVTKEGWAQKTAIKVIGSLGSAAAKPEFLTMLANLLTNNDYNEVVIEVIGVLGSAAATPEILTMLAHLLTNKDYRKRVIEVIGEIGSAAATPEILAITEKLLSDKNTDNSTRLIIFEALGKLCITIMIPEVQTQLAAVLQNCKGGYEYYQRKKISETIGKLGNSFAKPEFMIAVIKLLAQNTFIREKPILSAQILPQLIGLYLCCETNLFSKNKEFPMIGVTIIIGSYLATNISFNVDFSAVTGKYHLQGFVDKIPFSISITHEQAQWFIYWTPKIIQNFDSGKLDKILIEIENVGMTSSSKNSLAWFDNSLSSNSSASSTFSYQTKTTKNPRQAYGLPQDAVIDEESYNKKCVVM